MFTYQAFGIGISSEIELPELAPAPSLRQALRVLRRDLPDPPLDQSAERFDCGIGPNGDIYLYWDQVGVFCVSSDGHDVVVGTGPEIDPAYVRLALLGPVIGLALRNLGCLVLHASAVLVNGTACLFVGQSGAGKSTMAAALHRAGHYLLCDDIVAMKVPADNPGPFRVDPGISRIKLWPDSAQVVTDTDSKVEPLYDGFDKLALTLPGRASDIEHDCRVKAIFFLTIADELVVQSIHGIQAVLNLVANSYAAAVDPRLSIATAAGELGECGRLAASAETVILKRPADLERLPDVVRLVEEFVSSDVPGSSAVQEQPV